MKTRDSQTGLTPSGLMDVMFDIQSEHFCTVQVGLELVEAKGGALKGLLTATASHTDSQGDVRVFGATMEWPTSTHKTMIGAWYFMLLGLALEIEASEALAKQAG